MELLREFRGADQSRLAKAAGTPRVVVHANVVHGTHSSIATVVLVVPLLGPTVPIALATLPNTSRPCSPCLRSPCPCRSEAAGGARRRDLSIQRFKALETSAIDGGWNMARHQELIAEQGRWPVQPVGTRTRHKAGANMEKSQESVAQKSGPGSAPKAHPLDHRRVSPDHQSPSLFLMVKRVSPDPSPREQ